MQAEKAVRWDGVIAAVPIMRLAQISGYLALQQITSLVKENVATRVTEWRDRPSSAGSEPSVIMTALDFLDIKEEDEEVEEEEEEEMAPRQADVTHDLISFDKLLTMADVKQMAVNMNRQAKNREERKTTSSQDDDEEDW